MATIVQTTDFIGENKISQQCFADLGAYITTYEKHYLVRLLGSELYDLFIADLAGNPLAPVSAIYLSIFNEFQIDDGDCLYISEGMRLMLTQFIYFHFLRDQVYKNTDSGVVMAASSNAEILGYSGANQVEAYNRAVSNYTCIQWFIDDNDTDYPTENMQPLHFISGI